MHEASHSERILTELDHARLSKLLEGRELPALADLLDSTEVVLSHEIPADVVTMYSQVEIVDSSTRRRHALTICYPHDAEPAAGLVSVLSPVGTSLLGLKPGAVAKWQMPGGEEGGAEIAAIVFQPEARGDYTR